MKSHAQNAPERSKVRWEGAGKRHSEMRLVWNSGVELRVMRGGGGGGKMGSQDPGVRHDTVNRMVTED